MRNNQRTRTKRNKRGDVVYDELGSPQGSIVSPVIANAFLDHVLDQWFVTMVRLHCRGYGALLRYAEWREQTGNTKQTSTVDETSLLDHKLRVRKIIA